MNGRLRRRSLSGSGVVVVGATSGIGRAAAVAFAGHGCRLLVTARDRADLDVVARECELAGARSVAVCAADIGHPPDVERLAASATAELGVVDVWANTAACLLAGDLVACPVDELERLVATNVLGTMLASRAALRIFDAQGHGTLINLSSLLGLLPNPLVPAYCASKFAVRGLTLTLQQTPRPRSIAICLVVPGPVDTPMFTHAGNHTGRPLRAIPPAISPWRAASVVVACARRPRRTMTTGATGWCLLIAHRLTPRLVEWGVARYSATCILRPGSAPATSGGMFTQIAPGEVTGGFRLSPLRRRLGDRVGRWSARRG